MRLSRRALAALGVSVLVATVTVATGSGAAQAAPPPPVDVPVQHATGAVTPSPSGTLLDTRTDQAPDGSIAPIPAAGTRSTRVGVPSMQQLRTAVVSVEVLAPAKAGTLTLAATAGAARTAPADVTYAAHEDRVTTVVVPVGPGGQLAVSNHGRGAVDVVITGGGGVVAGSETNRPGGTVSVTPTRVLDADPTGGAGFGRRTFAVAGAGAVPASGVSSVLLSVTVVAPSGPGQLDTGSSDADTQSLPLAPQLTFAAGRDTTGTVWAPVGDDGTTTIAEYSGPYVIHVVADVIAYTLSVDTTDLQTVPPGSLVPLPDPVTIVDTRATSNVGGYASLVPGAPVIRPTVPTLTDEHARRLSVSGLLLAVTTVGASGAGVVAVGSGLVSYRTGAIDTDVVLAPVGADDAITAMDTGTSTTDVIIQAIAYLSARPWQATSPAPRQTGAADLAVDTRNDHAFVADPDIDAVDVYHDQYLVHTIVDQPGASAVSVHAGSLYVARARSGDIERFSLTDFTDLGTYATGLPGVSRLAWSGNRLWASSPVSTEVVDTLWSVGTDGRVVATDGLGGDIVIAPGAPGVLWSSACGQWCVYRVDVRTARPRPTSVALPPEVQGPLAVDDGGTRLYVGGYQPTVLDTASGAVLQSSRLPFVSAAVASAGNAVAWGAAALPERGSALVTGTDVRAPRLVVVPDDQDAGDLGGVWPHGVTIANGKLYVATRVAVGGLPGYRLASYTL